MRIPKQARPVRRAGLKNHLKTKISNKVFQSDGDNYQDDDVINDGEDQPGNVDDNDTGDAGDTGNGDDGGYDANGDTE